MAENGKIEYSVELNISGLEKQAEQVSNSFQNMGDRTERTGRRVDAAFDKNRQSMQNLGTEAQTQANKMDSAFTSAANNIGKAMAMMGIAAGVQEFGSKVMQIRGEFQKLEVAFETMLGSAEKSNDLMMQLVQTAATTPFDLQGIANGAKQLLAFGQSSETITDTLVRLGNIASGLSIPLNDMVYLYGTTMVQGRLFTQDLRQFTGRGIPLMKELAKQFGVAESAVGGLVTEGKVGFPQVKKAIEDMTNEGGQFAGLMEKQSKTISGQISNLEDSIDMMFNEIGKNSEGLISGALGAVSTLIENYEKVGEAIFYVIEAYGAYKAALIAVAAVQRINMAVLRQAVVEKNLAAAAGISLSNAEAIAAARTKLLQVAQMGLIKSLRAVTAATLTNPYVLFAAAVVAATFAIRKFIQTRSEEYKVQKRVNDIREQAAEKLEEEKDKIEQLRDAARDESLAMKDRVSAINQLNEIIPNYNAQLDAETGKYRENKAALDAYLTSLAKKYELEGAKDQLKQLGKEIAEARINIVKAQRDLDKANAERNKNYGSVPGVTSMQPQGLPEVIHQQGVLDDANKDLKIKLKQRQLIYDTFGNDLKATANEIEETESQIPPDKPKKTKKGTPKKDDRAQREKEILETIEDLRRDNEQKVVDIESDETKQKLAQYELDKKNRLAELDKTHAELVKKRGGNLTEDEEKSFTEARLLAQKEYDKKIEDLTKERLADQLQAELDYLKEYGTVQEQMYSIAKEYDEKIKKETDPNKRKILEQQKLNETSALNAKNLAMEVDWGSVFSGVGDVLSDIAKETLQKVEEYMKTDEFKKLSAENKKTYTDLQQKLREEGAGGSTSPFNFKIWGDIDKNVKDYQESIKKLRAAQEAHNEALEDMRIAENNWKNATDESSKEIAQIALDAAKDAVSVTGEDQTRAQEESDKAKQTLTENTNAAAQGIQNFTSYLNEMTNGSLYGFANGITKLITSLASGSNGVGKALGELGGKIGGIVGAILQIIDALGDDPAKFIGDLLDKIANVVEGIISNLPQIVVRIVEGVINIIKGIITGIGSWFGAGDFFNNSNAKEVQELTEKLTKSNESLRRSIDKLKDTIDNTSGTSAIENYEDAYEKQKRIIEQQRQMLEAQMGYHDSHHSNAYYWNLGTQNYRKINQLLGTNVWSLDQMYKLTPEQMDKIRMYLTDVWQAILDQGKYDKSEYWEAYADEAGKLEDLTKQISENLTQTSFSSLRDQFVSALMDMDTDAESFADNFSEYMMKALLNAKIGDLLDDELDSWYNDWAQEMKAKGGSLSAADIQKYRDGWNAIVKQGIEIRDGLAELTEYDKVATRDSESGSNGGWQSMGQETAEELNGRFTALQINSERMIEIMIGNHEALEAISLSRQNTETAVMEMNQLVITCSDLLTRIAKNSDVLPNISERLDQIKRNTDRL